MRNLKFIIATIALGLLASCSVDENDIAEKINENCGCESRTIKKQITYVTYIVPPSSLEMQLWNSGMLLNEPQSTTRVRVDTETTISGWNKIACATPGMKTLTSGIIVETKCN